MWTRIRNRLNPWHSLILSFGWLIMLGSILLLLPPVQHLDGLTFTDAVFESTSAVCVTGLTTVSTTGFNFWGQLALLLLMQLGAIGIMTFTSSFMLALRGQLRLRDRVKFSTLQESSFYEGSHLLQNILKITFVTEFIGFLLLTAGFLYEGFSPGQAAWHGLFHAVSAFCNAGFSTFDSSVTGLNPLIKFTIAGLIVMGGLGYYVIFELMLFRKRRHRLSLHSRVVLLTTAWLIVVGALLLYLFEGGHLGITDSIFQSVTARTAGFNSVDMNILHYPSIFLLMLLMFIGASPGSTGGGIKTTSFFVIVYSILSVLKGKTEVVYSRRRIGFRLIMKSFATAVIYFAVIFSGTLLLLQDNNIPLKDALFEAVSAMGTVGLSLGITPQLSIAGKWVLIALMFIGRVGPASFAMATLIRRKEPSIKYPEGTLF